MAEFLTTSAGTYQIEQIILTAKDQLFLFSPYLKFSKTMFERLKDTAERNIKITIIYGKNELKATEKQKLLSLDNVSLYFFENLHAKCYFNEGSMVITSMNIYEFSEKNNREMGDIINAKSGFKRVYTRV
ncbi:MAG: phospholipase D-like domain-containing protein [Methylococcales bacterium]|nr:phospholipase D-like domain-containing protein [Methylococcales bacterium]